MSQVRAAELLMQQNALLLDKLTDLRKENALLVEKLDALLEQGAAVKKKARQQYLDADPKWRAGTLAEVYRDAPGLLARDARDADAILREWCREGRTKKGMTCDQANRGVRKIYRRLGRLPTARKLAEELGCSPALIVKTKMWKTYQEEHGNTKAPKAIRLSEKLLQTIGHDDNQLKKLKDEALQRDERPSPATRRARH